MSSDTVPSNGDIGRKEPGYRSKEERLKDFHGVERRLTDEDVYEQATRCLDCGTPFCHGCGCPLMNIIPEFNDRVRHHRWRAALGLLLARNPFPEFTARICPALCEASCVMGIHDEPVTIRQLEFAIIEKGFELGYIVPEPPRVRRSERVAIIGSGPAGLAAADLLNKLGFGVVVYESAGKPGGILRYGIPNFKLEKWVLDRRIQLMEDEGVVFENGVEVGRDVSDTYLAKRFQAVVITGGALTPRDLVIPGRELKGVHFAMEYLTQQNMKLGGETVEAEREINAAGKNVVVMGGGDTGSDCLGTALRQGGRQVYQFEILPKPPAGRSPATPWPLWPDMVRESSSHKEGGERRWCVTAKALIGENGQVRSMTCVEVNWTAADGSRLRVPVETPGSAFTVEADLVLLAMGFVGPGNHRLIDALGLEKDSRGFIRRDRTRMTLKPGVFVAGDMTQGASLVVRAIVDGQDVARNVVTWLEGRGK